MISIYHIFSYNPVSLKKDRTSSILMFSNRSINLFILKNWFFIRMKALYSMRMCLTVQGEWHVKHCSCCSSFSIKEWVSFVWPMCNRDIMTCSLLDFCKARLHSSIVGWIWKSLLWILLFQCCWHFAWKSFLILGFRSVCGILKLSGIRSKADFAAESTYSFPLTPMWLGIQHIIISLQLDFESSLLSGLIIREFSSFFIT